MRTVFKNFRYVLVLIVFSCLVGSLSLCLYGVAQTAMTVWGVFQTAFEPHETVDDTAFHFIELADIFLVSTVLLIMGFGLHALFLGDLDLPEGIKVKSFDQLKAKLIGVVVVAIAIIFVGEVIRWNHSIDILYMGGAVAAVVSSLALFNKSSHTH